jgi:hypothetical protein
VLGNMKNSELFRGGVGGMTQDRVGVEVAKAGGVIKSGLTQRRLHQ